MSVIACVKPVPLGEPGVAKGQIVTEGLAWGLPASERRTVAAGVQAAQALGTDLAALALGPQAAQAGLREALALGAKRAVLVESSGQRLDALMTARALAVAIKRLGPPGVVVTGGESADAQQGLLGPMLAELLGSDLVAGVERVQGSSRGLVLHRAGEDEDERWQAQQPVVLAVSPRFQPAPHATSWGLGQAYALPLQVWGLAELQLPPEALEPGSEVASLAKAEQARREAERFEGEPDEAAAQLVRRLRAGGWVP